MRRCANHPDRPALARCMACQKALCQECSTPWEGIHYCTVCLEQLRGAARSGSSLWRWLLVAATSAALLLAVHRLRILIGTVFGGWF